MSTAKNPNFELFLKVYRARAKTEDDRKLIELFENHSRDVGEHFESCIGYVAGYLLKLTRESMLDGFGPQFHKGFRQWDVTSSGAADVEIWKLLSTGDTCFWDVLSMGPRQVARVLGEDR